MIRLLKPDVDPALFLSQIEANRAPPTAVQHISQPLHTETSDTDVEESRSGATLVIEDENEVGLEMEEQLEMGEEVEQQLHTAEKNAKEPTAQMDDVMDIVRQITTDVEPNPTAKIPEETHLESIPVEKAMMNEPIEEAEQPLLTPEEIAANLAARNSKVTRVEMVVEKNLNVEWNPTDRVETIPVEGVETNIDVPERREIVIVTDKEEEAEKVPPGGETAEAKAAAVRTYQ